MATIIITGSTTPPSGTLAANTILDFQGGKYVGGILTGNGTIIKAPPYQIFDGVTLAGTWKIDHVYAEYFGDTDGTNAAPAINKALEFSNLTGCKVMLLAKEYKITQSIVMRGGTTLEGQIPGNSMSGNGTKITVNDTTTGHAIDMLTQGNQTSALIDCYRFAVRNICIYNTTGDNSISIRSTAQNGLTSRDGVIENVLIQHGSNTSGGYGIYISGASYIRFERISINGGKGILFDTNTTVPNAYQEFVWMRQISVNGVTDKSIEIRKGNNIYITETDVRDSTHGVYIYSTIGGTFAIFMQSLALTRCSTGISIYAQTAYISRLVMRDVTVFVKPGNTAIRTTKSGPQSGIFDSLFDNIMIDRTTNTGAATFSVDEVGNSMSNCRFTNLRFPGTNAPSISSSNKWSGTFI